MKTVRDEFLNLMRDWRKNHPDKAHYTDTEILGVFLTSLSKSHPERVQMTGYNAKGEKIWKLTPTGKW